MRLGIRLLNTGAQLNIHNRVSQVKVARGETVDLYIQLVDLDQKELRYVPDTNATVQIQIPRAIDVSSDNNGGRIYQDNTIDRAATAPFAGDRSIWKIRLIESETLNLVSSSIKVVVTEGGLKKLATASQAIKVIDGEDN